ncbi:hypothetical protein [Mucilaginibacter sp. SP1R1]|uniref:hypothetical protein n=1 Tax=Mucilaginibacter sp. SP1R1 TaxID=2723091 RepID=UPI00161BC636|nr:hypothetical protein [Mucilaginibacter sp. SP1R1]MBB6148326.1 hypothetical protein [Mucilaginibacter sp. SP1R1]
MEQNNASGSGPALEIIKKDSPVTAKKKDKLALPTISNPVINRSLKDLMIVARIEKGISFHCARQVTIDFIRRPKSPFSQHMT